MSMNINSFFNTSFYILAIGPLEVLSTRKLATRVEIGCLGKKGRLLHW